MISYKRNIFDLKIKNVLFILEEKKKKFNLPVNINMTAFKCV